MPSEHNLAENPAGRAGGQKKTTRVKGVANLRTPIADLKLTCLEPWALSTCKSRIARQTPRWSGFLVVERGWFEDFAVGLHGDIEQAQRQARQLAAQVDHWAVQQVPPRVDVFAVSNGRLVLLCATFPS